MVEIGLLKQLMLRLFNVNERQSIDERKLKKMRTRRGDGVEIGPFVPRRSSDDQQASVVSTIVTTPTVTLMTTTSSDSNLHRFLNQ